MYVAAAVSAESFADFDFEIEEIRRGHHAFVAECACGVDSAGAANEDFGVVLAVEVEQNAA